MSQASLTYGGDDHAPRFSVLRGLLRGSRNDGLAHRLSSRQRDEVGAALVALRDELFTLGHQAHAACVIDMVAIVVTCRDAECVASLFESFARHNAAGSTRTTFYAAAHRLRQIMEG